MKHTPNTNRIRELVATFAKESGVTVQDLLDTGRLTNHVELRRTIWFQLREMGYPVALIADFFGRTPMAIDVGISRCRTLRRERARAIALECFKLLEEYRVGQEQPPATLARLLIERDHYMHQVATIFVQLSRVSNKLENIQGFLDGKRPTAADTLIPGPADDFSES